LKFKIVNYRKLHSLKLVFAILLFLGSFLFFNVVGAASDSVDLNLQVTSFCNSNGICEPTLEESSLGCPADCGCNNNRLCELERMETKQNCPSDCSSNPGSGNDIFTLQIQNIFSKDITPNSATISWQTSKPAYCNLYFGATTEYENGTISETQFKIDHSAKLSDLQGSTIYHFKIGCTDTTGFLVGTGDYSFSTLSVLNNVSNLKISIGDTKLTLTWDNPLDSDFNKVRILRSTDFYPINPDQGGVVYEGDDTFFADTGLTNGIRYYYTVFAYNLVGDHSSSGAIVSGIPMAGPVIPSASPSVSPTAPPYVPPVGWEMSFGEFNFFVEGEDIIWFGESTIKIPVHKQMLVSIYDRQLPPHTKTIVFSIEKDDEAFSFLLSQDKTKTLHEAAIPPTLGVGNYSITISIFNQENELISEIKGELRLGRVTPVFQFRWYYELPIYIIVLLIAVILIIFGLEKERDIFAIIRRKNRKN